MTCNKWKRQGFNGVADGLFAHMECIGIDVVIQCEVCKMILKCGNHLVMEIVNDSGFRVVASLFWCDLLEGLLVQLWASIGGWRHFPVVDVEVASSLMLVSPLALTSLPLVSRFPFPILVSIGIF
jgi:hypothetical protein